jgi:hypothetical protein
MDVRGFPRSLKETAGIVRKTYNYRHLQNPYSLNINKQVTCNLGLYNPRSWNSIVK